MARSSKKSAEIFALVMFSVAVISAVALITLRGKTPAVSPAARTAQPLPSYAPKGELAPGFPKELILDSKATPSGSYAINYSAGSVLRTASFDSGETMLSLFSLYKTYFNGNGWSIINEITQYEDSRGLYAVKGGAVSSVTIVNNGKTRQVMVGYSGE